MRRRVVPIAAALENLERRIAVEISDDTQRDIVELPGAQEGHPYTVGAVAALNPDFVVTDPGGTYVASCKCHCHDLTL